MPKLNQVRCVLAVNDHRKSADFYREKLGFKLDLEVEGWLSCWAIARTKWPATRIGDHSWFAYADMDDVDGLYSEYKAKGVKWGTREFSIETPDGHRIMFGQEINVP